MTQRRTYHHGQLRPALIAAALALLKRGGAEALTVRAIAAEAGVSHGAPAHHFADLRAVLTAVAAHGFDRLRAALADAQTSHDTSAAVAMRAVSDAYVEFALGEPGLFTLMFSPERIQPSDADFRRAARSAYGELEAVTAMARDCPGFNATDMEYLIWSSAHGYAQLALARVIPKPGRKFSRSAPDVARLLFTPSSRGRA